MAIVLGITLALSLVTATQVGPASPEGKYYDKSLATEGLAYYEFKDGKVTLVAPLGVRLAEGAKLIAVGTYAKRGEKWIWTFQDADGEAVFRAGVFAIEIDGIKENGAVRFPRYWFPR